VDSRSADTGNRRCRREKMRRKQMFEEIMKISFL
jgi:hypothetical protein